MLGIHVVSIGSLNAAVVHPRETFQRAILQSANAIICFHNHPSGYTTPSLEDQQVTLQLMKVGEILWIELVDHLIFGDSNFLSLKDVGIIA